MSLRARLESLRRQSGSGSGAPGEGPDLADRVGRLRARAGTGSGAAPNPASLVKALDGALSAAGVIRSEGWVGPDELPAGAAPVPTELPDAAGWDPRSLVFLDTETTGLTGGAGSLAFLVGLARWEGDGLRVRQLLLTRFGGESELLAEMMDWLGAAEAVVTYNGKRFDAPLLADRARLHGSGDPLQGLAHLDLLYPVRRVFGNRWPDCRLASAEGRLLGVARINDLPGAEAPQAWFDWLQRADSRRLPAVARHNRQDLISLAGLLPALDHAHQRPADVGGDPLGVARAWLRRGDEERAFALLRAGKGDLDRAGRLELARLLRRRERWVEAVVIWEALARAGCAEALEHLAKYHEHVSGDLARGLACAQRLPDSAAARCRRERLRAKLARAGGRPQDPGASAASWS